MDTADPPARSAVPHRLRSMSRAVPVLDSSASQRRCVEESQRRQMIISQASPPYGSVASYDLAMKNGQDRQGGGLSNADGKVRLAGSHGARFHGPDPSGI